MPSPAQSLPVEIHLLILEAIPFDETNPYNTLSSCAITCQAWLPQARTLLYRKIFLSSPRHYALFSRTLAEKPELGPLVREIQIG